MTDETSPTETSPGAIEPSATDSERSTGTKDGLRFAMVALYVRDLQRSVDFYRLLGLQLSDPHPGRPVVSYRENGVRRMILATDAVARDFDPDRVSPDGAGYQHTVEFFVDHDAAVDDAWARLTGRGYRGIREPGVRNVAYTTLVEDPDRNAVMITHDPQASAS